MLEHLTWMFPEFHKLDKTSRKKGYLTKNCYKIIYNNNKIIKYILVPHTAGIRFSQAHQSSV